MNFLDFNNHYPDEESCKLAFKAHREQTGTYFYIIAVHSPARYKEVFTGTVNVFGN